MNRQRIAMLALTVALGALTLSAPTIAQPAPGQPALPASAVPAFAAGQRGMEPHPQIRMALRSLEDAQRRLENSEHVFGGHRAKALALTTRAINELEKALARR